MITSDKSLPQYTTDTPILGRAVPSSSMFSLHLCPMTWYRAVCANKVPVFRTTAAFMPSISRAPVYNPVQTISVTCSVNAYVDTDDSSTISPRQSPIKEYIRGPSVFSAGTAKATAEKQKELLGGKLHIQHKKYSKIALPSKPLSADEWNSLNVDYKYHNFEDNMMGKLIDTNADLNIAKSLLSYVAVRKGDVPYRLLIKYLVLCVQQKQTTEIYDICDIMKSKYETLDTGFHCLLIKGLSDTERWREAIASLEILKNDKPTTTNYRECIKGAIKHGENELAWTLYDEMLHRDLTPSQDTIQSLFNVADDLQDEAFRKRLYNILTYFRENQIYPGQPLMKSIKSWFERIPNEKWKGQLTIVTDDGRCNACKEQLESICLTPEEFNTLKTEVIERVVKGENTFRKTTPDELQTFFRFVDSRPPYDIVVDGLNVAHVNRANRLSKTLLSIVSCLAASGKRILVLGRKHMLQNCQKWVKTDIQLLQKHADCFYFDNVSLDDPFLLYACLSSGTHCSFITGDLLRDHKACLSNTQTQRLFFKWQRGHQLVIQFYFTGNVTLRPTLTYDTIVQNTQVSWHIPYDEIGVKRATYEVPKTWLCLKKIS